MLVRLTRPRQLGPDIGVGVAQGAIWTPASEATLAALYEAETARLVYGASPLVAQWNPTAGSLGGNLAQAAAAAQPTATTLGAVGALQIDAGDYMVSSLASSAFKFLHYKAGNGARELPDCTVATVLNIASLDTSRLILDTGTAPGFRLYATSTGQLVVSIRSAVGEIYASMASAAGAITAGATALITVIPSAAGCVARINKTPVIAGTPNANASNADPSGTLYVGATIGAALSLVGKLSDIAIFTKSFAGTDLSNLENHYYAKHGL